MKIAMINGSSKSRSGISDILLAYLKAMLESADSLAASAIQVSKLKDGKLSAEETKAIVAADSIVFAFPLYVDGLPAPMLSWLMSMENAFPEKRPLIYAVANCGYYEGIQSQTAISILKNWAVRAGVPWGAALAVGGGPMYFSAKIAATGPGKATFAGLEALARHILLQETADDRYTSPSLPRFLYSFTANQQWKRAIRARGLKVSDLGKKA